LSSTVWALVRKQHGVVTREQLLELGFSRHAIEHRLRRGRLHRVYTGVYAVGRRNLSRYGEWMAAVLRCGPTAVLSHEDAAALWEIRDDRRRAVIDVSVMAASPRRTPGIRVRRRPGLTDRYVTIHRGIPVTTPACTIIDLMARRLPRTHVEAAIKEADIRDLVDPEELRAALDEMPRWPGAAALRKLLDRRTFVMTNQELERRFVPLARRAGLPRPETGCYVNGYEVDFYWPDLPLVVETDGLRYHRTPQQQTKDRMRDQAHTLADLPWLRFTHEQIRYEPEYVVDTLAAVAARLRAAAA
jgi:very-short-patch-repair endonuclease